MKLLADENAEGPLIARLREEAYDVTSVGELGGGIDDPEVLEISEREGRILLTNDKDFAELAFLQRTAVPRRRLSSCWKHCGTSAAESLVPSPWSGRVAFGVEICRGECPAGKPNES